MALLKGRIDTNNWIKMLLIGLVFLYVITSVINISAITSDDETEEILKDLKNRCVGATGSTEEACLAAGGTWTLAIIPNTFTLVIVAVAAYLAFSFAIGFGQGRLDKKRFISMVILAVVLYVLWNKILVPSGFFNLDEIQFAAAQLQAMVIP